MTKKIDHTRFTSADEVIAAIEAIQPGESIRYGQKHCLMPFGTTHLKGYEHYRIRLAITALAQANRVMLFQRLERGNYYLEAYGCHRDTKTALEMIGATAVEYWQSFQEVPTPERLKSFRDSISV